MARNETPDGGFPHGYEPKVLELDLDAGMVQITYLREGQEIVETWRIIDVPRDGG